MKKRMKQSKRDPRWFIGGLVALAIVAIMGFKWLKERSTTVVLLPTLATMTREITPTSVVDRAIAATPTTAPLGPAQAPTSEAPFPSHPTDQVEWAMRHKKPMMVLFHSTNCIPCKAMEKLVNQIRSDYDPGIVFVDVITNDRANIELIRQVGIQAIPTSFFINASGQGKRFVGAMKEDALRAELAELLKE